MSVGDPTKSISYPPQQHQIHPTTEAYPTRLTAEQVERGAVTKGMEDHQSDPVGQEHQDIQGQDTVDQEDQDTQGQALDSSVEDGTRVGQVAEEEEAVDMVDPP